jgi:hypothetical protein
MKNNVVAGLLALGFGLLTGVQANAQGAAVAAQMEVKATVENVDQASRQVLLSGDDGTLTTVVAGPEVRNLAQVKAGDHVVLRVRVGVLATMAPANGAGGPGGQATVAARAAKGATPGGYVADATRVRVTFNGYVAKTKTVSYSLPTGEQRSNVLRTKAMQDFAAGLKAGDKVDVTFTRSVAIAVVPMK